MGYDPHYVNSLVSELEKQLLKQYHISYKWDDFTFLRVHYRNGKTVLIYRVLDRDTGWFYIEFTCTGYDDLLGVDNISNSKFPYSLLQLYIKFYLDKQVSDTTLNDGSAFDGQLKILEVMENFQKLIKNSNEEEAWRQYKELSNDLLSVPEIRYMGLRIAFTEANYDDLGQMYKDFFHDFPNLDLSFSYQLALRYKLNINDLPGAIEVLDRIDKRVGRDPYLIYEKAKLFFLAKQYNVALRYCMKVFKYIPHHTQSIILTFRICCAEQRYDEAILCLKSLKSHKKRLPMLLFDPEYSDFIQSPEFLRYKQEQQ